MVLDRTKESVEMAFGKLSLARRRVDAIPREVLVEELRKVAAHFGGRRFSRHDFDRVATQCKGSAVLLQFGSWNEALKAVGAPLRPHKPDRKQISNAQLLSELARIWRQLGHRPSKLEWDASNPAYSYTTYEQRFGGWINACAALVGGETAGFRHSEQASALARFSQSRQSRLRVGPESIRAVPLKLRLRVLSRDKFRCVLCGRTPALHAGVVLHVDHIVPFSKGGRTAEANLRSLCAQCNWGRGSEDRDAV